MKYFQSDAAVASQTASPLISALSPGERAEQSLHTDGERLGPASLRSVRAFPRFMGLGKISSGLVLFALFLFATNVPAQFPSSIAFSNNFSAGLPSGMTLAGTATVGDGYLKLTTQTPGGQLGTAFWDGLPSVQGVRSFRATLKAALFGGTVPPADGFSFSLAPAGATPNSVTPGEEGLTSGLSISFDTYDNGGEPASISVRWNGVLMGEQVVQVSTSPGGLSDPASRLRDISIQLDPDGTIDLAHNGVVIFDNLPTSYAPIYGGRWVLSARTGGSTDNHWFKELNIAADLTAPLPALSSGYCLNFGDGHVAVAHAADLNSLPFSFAAWVRVPSPQGILQLLHKGEFNGPDFFGISAQVANGEFNFTFVPSPESFGLGVFMSGGSLGDGQWHHVAVTVNSNASYAYVDGVQVDSNGPLFLAPGPSTSAAPLYFGHNPIGRAPLFGQLDEITWWNTELTPANVAAARLGTLSTNAPGLVALWRLDEGIGATATDATGRGHAGSLLGTVGWVPQPFPRPGSRPDATHLHFAQDGWVQIPNSTTLTPFPLTVSAWIRSTNVVSQNGGQRTVVAKLFGPVPSAGYSLHFTSDGRLAGWFHRQFDNFTAPETSLADGLALADGNWHHVAFTVDEVGGRLFIDGRQRALADWTGPAGPAVTASPLYIGGHPAFRDFDGDIDEVAIWSTRLSPSAIQAGVGVPLVGNESSLAAYYRFNEGLGATTADGTANRNNGTLVARVSWVLQSTPLRIFDARTALSFNGGVIEVPHNTNFNAMPITLSAWIRTTNANTRLLSKRAGSNNDSDGFELYLQDGVLTAGYALDDFTFFFPARGSAVNDGQWHHVLFSLNDNGGLLYIDGRQTFGSTWAFGSGRTASTEPFRIGSTVFRGEIDEVAVWNIHFNANTVAEMWSRRMDGNEPGLVALYHFDEPSGNTVLDATGHGFTGSWVSGITRVASGARVQDTTSIRGRLTAGVGVVTNTPVIALFGPQSGTGLISVPDNGVTESTNRIVAAGVIGLVKVSVNLEHPFRGDLELTLIHPDGTEVRLKDANVNDDGADWIAAYPDNATPVASLAALNGKPMAGAWRLRVRDAFGQDVGRLNAWSLALGTAPTLSDAFGDYAFSNLFNATFTVQPVRAGFAFSPPSRTVASATSGVNFELASGFIAGRVTGAGGTPLAEATVSAAGVTATADSGGNYRLAALPPGTFTVTAALAGHAFAPAQLASFLGDSNANFVAVSFPVSGRVVDLTSNGVAGVTVRVGGQSAVTDIDGNYSIDQVAAGARTITPNRGTAIFVPASRNVTSGPAQSGVNFVLQSAPPTIVGLRDRVIARNTSTGPLRFDVDDRETRPGFLTLAGSSSDPTIVPDANIVFGGVGNARTVTITPRSEVSGTVAITVRVTDEAGLSGIQSFSLRVNSLPQAGIGGALRFAGTDGEMDAQPGAIGIKGTYTVECWASAPSNAGPRVLITQGIGTNLFAIATDNAGRIRVSGQWDTAVPFPYGGWHHFAVVKEVADTHLYVDGVRRASRGSPLPFPASTLHFYVGRDLSGAARWNGEVEEVRVWSRARTAAEVASNQTVRVLGAAADLVALWRLDERAGSNAVDEAANAHPGALRGGVVRIPSAQRFTHYTTTEDTPFTDRLQAYDPDNDVLNFRIVTPPQRGTVTLLDTNTGVFTYTPNPNASGEDRFSFNVSDGYAETEVALLTLAISPDTNAPSISFVGNQTVEEDATLELPVFTVGDAEVAAENLVMSAASSNPALVPVENITFRTLLENSGSNRTATLRPALNANGTVTISLIVSDGKLTATNRFLLTITPVNDAPTISLLTNQVTRRSASVSQAFVISDVDTPSDGFTATIGIGGGNVVAVANTGVTGNGANRIATVTGAANQSGTVTMVVTVGDGQALAQASYSVRVNEPPSISAIPTQSTFRNVVKLVPVAVSDPDTAFEQLAFSASSSNPTIVDNTGLTVTGSIGNYTLAIRPVSGAVGVTTIAFVATDGIFSSTNTFTLFVEETFDYTLTELPNPAGTGTGGSIAVDINEQGRAIGTAFIGVFSPRAVYWDLSTAQPTVTQLFPEYGYALGLNNAGDIVGDRNTTNFLYRNGLFSTPLTPPLGSSALGAMDINDAGNIIGATPSQTAQTFFDGIRQTNLVGIFETPLNVTRNSIALSDEGDVFGRSTDRTRVLVWQVNADGSRTLRDLGGFGGTQVAQGGINNSGDVCVNVLSNGVFAPLIYNYRRNTLVTNLLPALRALVPAGVTANFFALDINGSGEVVGSISTNAPGGGSARFDGFLYSDGRAVALQQFAAPNGFQPVEPTAINDAGDIVGRGIKPGTGVSLYAFLLRRQVIVGRPLSPPLQALNPATRRAFQPPQVEAIDGTPLEQASTAYLWSDLEQKLYFTRPMAARVTWLTTADLGNTNAAPPVVRVMRAVFPADPQLHVAGAPVNVEPLAAASPYRAIAMNFSTVPGAVFDPGTKALSLSQPGYTVIRYLLAPEAALGASPDPLTHSNYFQVVRTVAWNDSLAFTDAQTAIVGTRVSDPRGPAVATNSPKSGWVVHPLAPYDGAGADAAYDRSTQTGPIIPVNRDTAGPNDDLVVAFYKLHPLTGALWPDLSARFNIQWPAAAPKLVIANPRGSGPLPPAQFPDKRIYVQSSTNLPGYNPNEEHAFFAPSASGEGVFALRNDLNSDATSRPFVLLKYRDAATGDWTMRAYEVALTDANNGFTFSGEAGKEILPPYPLSLLPVCPETAIVTGTAFRDHRGKFHAVKGPTPADPAPQVVIRYAYPLQPTFFYDLNRDGTNEVALGGCVRWNGVASGSTTSSPVNVTYNVFWPTNTPSLQIGETLLNPKRGLPGIRNWAAAQVVFDTLNTNGNDTLSTTARLYDPLSTRTLRLTNVAGVTASYQLPADVALETRTDGKQSFSDLPYYLRVRLSYDPQNRWLSWSGVINENVLGEPLLLINVMSDTERRRIKQLSGEAKFQSIIDALYDLSRNPNGVDVNRDGAPDQDLLIGFTTNRAGQVVLDNFGDLPKALTAGLPLPRAANAPGQTNYLVLAENNDPALGASPVTLHVIRVEGGPFRGDVKLLLPDNVFDERLTLRHSSDFGGDPDRLQFEWWYHPDDADFNPVALPEVNPVTGQITDARGWRVFRPPAAGQNSITLGDGAETSLFTLIDNWFIVRYRGYNVGGATNWSAWVGDPSSAADTRAAFAPGWVKRVVEGINPFEARTTNFHDNASVTYASMLIQAGERYEGDIALNPGGGNVNNVGLIEAYTTVLNRGKRLSIDGLPAVDSDPANNALLLAASRIADFYMLLGNEAFSDAQDPTIGFFSDSLEFGTVATSIFAFQNQLDSLLEEELALLRGRDDSASGVGARPVYNRLLWNFTGAEGEVAYERVYNVGDVNLDGVINENDARILFPQGHGDAWGHYLTAVKTYYDLLRHPRFTWIPRTENVLVGGTAVRVDFLDERKFAAIAAQKAKTGAEIVDLSYRSKYVDNPEGQYQGYKDTRADRAWGVTEWARRVGQASYFDWLAGNAVLPSTDPNTNHVGIQKIDRQTVLELDEVIGHHREVQAQLDKVDKGLNPLGLAKGVVPFDIDPSLLLPSSGVQAQGHFEQVYVRAVQAMNNTVTMWNQANSLTEALRRQQDDVDEFTANVADQERDFKNRLIETFGYPYAGDIGAGKTYPSGYDGPDIYHYQYVNATELTGRQPSPRGFSNVLGYFKPFNDGNSPPSFYFGGDLFTTNVAAGPFLAVNYPLAAGDWAFTAPASFGARRAPGEIQLALSDLLQEETRLKQALNNYDGLIQQIEDMSQLLSSRVALSNRTITLLTSNRTTQTTLNGQITAAQDAQLGLRRISSIVSRVSEAVVQGIPQDLQDFLFPVDEITRAVIGFTSIGVSEALESSADISEGQQNRFEKTKEQTQLQTDIDLEVASQDFEVQQMAAELRQLLRSEAPMRLEALTQGELVRQSFERYLAAVATGQRLLAERTIFRQRTAGLAQQNRYKDIAFRIFRNDALQKYRAQFDLAVRYVYLAASAYDYELNFLGTDTRGARDFFTDIMRQRSLGVMVDGIPITGRTGLSDPLARLKQNFEVLSPRFGLNNPQQETARFSLRKELFRIRDGNDATWRKLLTDAVVPDLWQVPEFRRNCRPFAPEPAGPQPGIVLRFPTTVTFGLNFFEHALGGGDTAYDPSLFSTKINAVGVWFSDYSGAGLANAPRIYFFPAGIDVMRSPTGNTLATREYKILDQVVPVPFPIGASDVDDPTWIPINDSLAESFAQIRRYSSFRAYHDNGVYDDSQSTKDTRLIGRSVWNTDWVLIIPGGTLLNDPKQGLEQFIDSVSDILISLQSYSYSGD